MADVILDTINIAPLLKAKAMLDEALEIAQSPLEKTGAIQCFEYCYELAWKTMRRILLKKGLETASPRDTFRAAATNRLIEDPEVWFEFIKKRNLTTHTYNLALAEKIFCFLPDFQSELDKLVAHIQSIE